MARFQIGKLKQDKKGWQETLIDRIQQGKVLPLISNVVTNRLVFSSHRDLVESWAEYIEYPLDDDRLDLTRLTQFQSVMDKANPDIKADNDYIKEAYLDFLHKALLSIADQELVEELKKEANLAALPFSQKAERLEYPSFADGQQNLLLLLADLPLPIYLTTSYHSFMETALLKAGKKPRTEICHWHSRLDSVPSAFSADPAYEPTPQEPLVYHLHGLDKHPESLVLTEDDHLDFLVTISRDMDAVPVRIRQALADSSLILLGYSLRDWDFRVIFRGMIKPGTVQNRPKSVFIQLLDNPHERTFLQNYLYQEAKFEVYWGNTTNFLQEIWQGWRGSR